jgi:hypothetical protein
VSSGNARGTGLFLSVSSTAEPWALSGTPRVVDKAGEEKAFFFFFVGCSRSAPVAEAHP